MSEVVGKMLTCDRCKEWIFLKKLDEVDSQSGFPIESYEKPEATWYRINGEQFDLSPVLVLCPYCYEEFYKKTREFLLQGGGY